MQIFSVFCYNLVANNHWSYLLVNFLRSLFVVHDWSRAGGSTVRTCRICGRREELDIDDGVNLAAWHPVWDGYPRAHLARQPGASAVPDTAAHTTGNRSDMNGADSAVAPVSLARIRK
jgi:hypothetical protein